MVNSLKQLPQLFKDSWQQVFGVRAASAIAFIMMMVMMAVQLELSEFLHLYQSVLGTLAWLVIVAVTFSIPMHSFARQSMRHLQEKHVAYADVFYINLSTFRLMAAVFTFLLVIYVINVSLMMLISYGYLGLGYVLGHEFFFRHLQLLMHIKVVVWILMLLFELTVLFFIPFVIYCGDAKFWNAWLFALMLLRPLRLQVIVIYVGLLVINFLGAALAGVGLIWTVPWTALVLGRYYRLLQGTGR